MTIGIVTLIVHKSVSESSSVPINSSICHTAFHPDDFTHPCHPLYVNPSHILGASLVFVPFDGTCYGSWRRNILVALSVHNKLDFINGTIEIPPLTNSLTKDISRSAEYSELAKDIWNELEERYGKTDGARIFELKKELAYISQESLDIASCFTKIKQLWDEIASISVNHLSVYTCGGNKKAEEEQKSKVSFNSLKPSLICKYCKKPGHIIEKCYKLHGLPPNIKFAKTTGPRKWLSILKWTNLVFLVLLRVMMTNPNFSLNNYLKCLLSHLSSSSSTPNLFASANFAGELLPKSGLLRTCLLTKIENKVWIIDSGTSDPMTSDKSLLFNIHTLPIPYLVSVPNGYKVKVTNISSLTLSTDLILHNVLYVPSFHYNLISLKKPVVFGRPENGLYKLFQLPATSFSCNSSTSSIIPCSIPCNVSPIECSNISRIDANMFSDTHVHDDHALLNKVNKEDVVSHYRLGHLPFSKMKCISNCNTKLSFKQSFTCPVCPLAKQTRLPFPDSSIQTVAPFQLIHIGTWGPYHASTYDGSKYFLTILDDYTRATWTHLLGAKNNAFDLLKVSSPLLNHKSPYELLYAKPPSYSHLRAFGSSPPPSTSALSSSPPQPTSSPSPITLRRSTRVHKQPSYLQSYRSGDSLVILVVYVDDIVLTVTDLDQMFALKAFLHAQFKIKDLGLLNFFLVAVWSDENPRNNLLSLYPPLILSIGP
ncbi:uncharacterized protein LOC142181703 [Nicotiana tabacum]|uniref:Uncharacterized protein LOC142181703 n=1 Tax=Nicotiana tabacum TaxID=4097 RepID=A0AC58UP17_TOBAC